MAARIRLRWVILPVAVMLFSTGLMYGAYRWGVEAGRADWLSVAARRGAQVRHYRDTSSTVLKELITREMSLREDGLTEWEIVNRLRDWAHANIDLATPSSLLDQDASFDYYNRSGAEIFAGFFQDRGGVWCGGAAYALMEIYRLFSFPASMMDSGKPKVMTHVVTLVRIKDSGMEKTVIQDPTLNVTYATASGAPYDYFELLAALMRHQHEGILVLQGNHGKGFALVHPGDDRLAFDHLVGPRAQPIQVLPNGVQKYVSGLSAESFERRFGERIHAFLRKEGHPGDLPYLFLYPLAGSDQSVVERAQQLTHRK